MSVMDHEALPRRVLERFVGDLPSRLSFTKLGNAGGFSGSQLWQVSLDGTMYCLRQWPASYPTPDRLAWIHSIQHHARTQGIWQVPQLQHDRYSNSTLVLHDRSCWELTTWMPGTADPHPVTPSARLQAAMQLLAHFHLAVRNFPPGEPTYGTSPGINHRMIKVQAILSGHLLTSLMRPKIGKLARLDQQCVAICEQTLQVAAVVQGSLAPWANQAVHLQPCLRDIHRDHVLFEGDGATGLIDYGAMQRETVAMDISRLLGSLARDDTQAWHLGLSAYQLIAELPPEIVSLVTVLDTASALLSPVQWLEWLLIERRQFENWGFVERRVNDCIDRLVELVRRGGRPVLPHLWAG